MPDQRIRVVNQISDRYPLELPEELAARVDMVHIPFTAPLDDETYGDVILTGPRSENVYEIAERGARWVHVIGTGIDGLDDLPRLARGRTVTNSKGAATIPISEWVVAMLLAAVKDLPDSWVTSPPTKWHTEMPVAAIHEQRVSLVGIGSIGTGVATRIAPFGVSLRAFRRSGRPVDIPGVAVEVVDSLPKVLDGADHVVIAAPLTADTEGMFDAQAFAAMKPGAHLVNVGRGGLVDQDALKDALDRGIVGRASLDTVTPEPLPAGHWMYSHPRVRLSPHVSYRWSRSNEILLSFFVDNLGRYARGEELVNVVDADAGY